MGQKTENIIHLPITEYLKESASKSISLQHFLQRLSMNVLAFGAAFLEFFHNFNKAAGLTLST